jgi:hypothetical protein
MSWIHRFFRRSIVGESCSLALDFSSWNLKIGIFIGQQRIGNDVARFHRFWSYSTLANGNYRLDLGEGDYNASASV